MEIFLVFVDVTDETAANAASATSAVFLIRIEVDQVTKSHYCYYYYVHVQLLSPNTSNRTSNSQIRVVITIAVAG